MKKLNLAKVKAALQRKKQRGSTGSVASIEEASSPPGGESSPLSPSSARKSGGKSTTAVTARRKSLGAGAGDVGSSSNAPKDYSYLDEMVDGGTKFLKKIGDHTGGKTSLDTRNNVGEDENLDEANDKAAKLFEQFGADIPEGFGGDDEDEDDMYSESDRDQLVASWSSVDPSLGFVGHNRNSITACAFAGKKTVFYADKTGAVNVFHIISQRKQTLKPQPQVGILCVATTALKAETVHESAKLERSTVSAIRDEYVACGGANGLIYVWNQKTFEYVGELRGHQAAVTSLAFRQGTSTLYSASKDGCLRSWSVAEQMSLEKLFGHKGHMWAVSCQNKERCVTGGEDRILRFWKVDSGTTVDYKPEVTAIESVLLLDDGIVVSGTRGGTISIFSVTRKNPIISIDFAHGYNAQTDGTGIEYLDEFLPPALQSSSSEGKNGKRAAAEVQEVPDDQKSPWLGNPISALAMVGNSNFFASGSCDGIVRLWSYNAQSHDLAEVQTVKVPGFINHLSFSPDGSTLAAVSAKEPKMGRWSTLRTVLNGIILVTASGDADADLDDDNENSKPVKERQPDEEFRPVLASKLKTAIAPAAASPAGKGGRKSGGVGSKRPGATAAPAASRSDSRAAKKRRTK